MEPTTTQLKLEAEQLLRQHRATGWSWPEQPTATYVWGVYGAVRVLSALLTRWPGRRVVLCVEVDAHTAAILAVWDELARALGLWVAQWVLWVAPAAWPHVSAVQQTLAQLGWVQRTVYWYTDRPASRPVAWLDEGLCVAVCWRLAPDDARPVPEEWGALRHVWTVRRGGEALEAAVGQTNLR